MTAATQQQDEMEDGGSDWSGPRRMLNEKQILQIVPVSAVTLWRLEKRGAFPKGTYISPNRKVWFEDEIIAWQNGVNGRGRGRRHHPAPKS
jgi:prophage regulatory protein